MWARSHVLETRVSLNGSVCCRATLEVNTVSLAVLVQCLAPLWHARKEVKKPWRVLCLGVVLWEFHTLPSYQHKPTSFGWICSNVWIPFLNDWQSLPVEPATDTPHLAGTWKRSAGETSGFYTVNRWCQRAGVPVGSWYQLWGLMKAPSPSFSFLSHPESQRLCKMFDMNVWIYTTSHTFTLLMALNFLGKKTMQMLCTD